MYEPVPPQARVVPSADAAPVPVQQLLFPRSPLTSIRRRLADELYHYLVFFGEATSIVNSYAMSKTIALSPRALADLERQDTDLDASFTALMLRLTLTVVAQLSPSPSPWFAPSSAGSAVAGPRDLDGSLVVFVDANALHTVIRT